MGARKAKGRPAKEDPHVLIVGWAPARPDQAVPFDPTTYSGARMRELCGRTLEHFALTVNLNPEPVADDDPNIAPGIRARACAVLQEFTLLRVLLVGRMTARAFGVERYLQKNGYLRWFLGDTSRQYAVMPQLTARSWWGKTENMQAARLFLRGLADAAPEAVTAHGSHAETIDLDELEHVCRVFGAPPVDVMASYFKVSRSTLLRRLREPEAREAWDRGCATAKAALYRARFEKAIRGGSDGLGDASMQRYLSSVLLGERVDKSESVHTGRGCPMPGDEEVVITRRQLEEMIRELDAEFQILEDQKVVSADGE